MQDRRANPTFTAMVEVQAGREYQRMVLGEHITDPKVIQAEYDRLMHDFARAKERHCTACRRDFIQLSAIAETLRLIGSLVDPLTGGVSGYTKLFTNAQTVKDVRDAMAQLLLTQILQNMAHFRALLWALNRRIDAHVESEG